MSTYTQIRQGTNPLPMEHRLWRVFITVMTAGCSVKAASRQSDAAHGVTCDQIPSIVVKYKDTIKNIKYQV